MNKTDSKSAHDVDASSLSDNSSANLQLVEKTAPHVSGMAILLLGTVLMVAALLALTFGIIALANESEDNFTLGIALVVISSIWIAFPGWLLFAGLKVVAPNEAYVLTLFGKYYGSLTKTGFFFVNPFTVPVNPLKTGTTTGGTIVSITQPESGEKKGASASSSTKSSKISLKAMTLSNNKQKINDLMGNPIEIGIVVIWRVVNTARAVFNVDNFEEYLSMQCDSALRNIVRLYPYDVPGDDEGEMSLRGSSQEIAERLKAEIQQKVSIAGLVVVEARITHLAYAPEIAAAMLQRQQASAIVDARTLIVKGAVGMVQQALSELDENGIVDLDEERKANMVSNLLVVLCGNKDAQPIVNSGSLY
ncbi:MAG: SPFH domain-containing protein [Coriobacteriales bacterium]|jgi:regulator of protease activity HflC (stomatin/prohibitin superfamily)|nr:SPFH domain-containing protein [Coriobacteriales bacterium]